MTTNQTLYAAMSRTACTVLDHCQNLPSVASVHIHSSVLGTHTFRRVIALQLAGDAIPSVPAWAVELGGTVRFLAKDGSDAYVEVTTETVVDGHTVVAWNLMEPEEAEQLAARLGSSLDDMAEVEPARILALAAVPAGGA